MCDDSEFFIFLFSDQPMWRRPCVWAKHINKKKEMKNAQGNDRLLSQKDRLYGDAWSHCWVLPQKHEILQNIVMMMFESFPCH